MISLLRRPLPAALAAAAIVLAIVLAIEFATGGPGEGGAGAARKPAAPPDAKLLPPVVAQAPEQAYPEMAARPLFTPTRRPAPAEPNQGKATFARGQFVLQGVIVVGDQRTALLKEKATGKVHRVDSGSDVSQGVRLERVEPTEVVLVSGDEREKIALVVQKPEVPGRGGATPEAQSAGPFGAAAPPAAAAAAAHPAVPATTAAAGSNPTGRAAPVGAPPGPAGTQPPPTAQPMTPEELLARRRARRNQPTQ